MVKSSNHAFLNALKEEYEVKKLIIIQIDNWLSERRW